jgi:hypothetical protein
MFRKSNLISALMAAGFFAACFAPVASASASITSSADERIVVKAGDERDEAVGIAPTDEPISKSSADNPNATNAANATNATSDAAGDGNRDTRRTAEDARRAAADAQRALADAGRAAKDAARAAADAARAAVDSVDVNEIRETVRRAMDEAGRGNVVINMSSDTPQRGNPYSARETREFKQTLGDGTVISRQSTRLLARDSEGRSRQELRQIDGTARVFINDPVAKQAIILDPQKKLACKAGFDRDAIYDCFKQMRGDWKPLGFSFDASSKGGIAMMTATDDLRIHVNPGAKVIDLTQPGQTSTWSKSWGFSGPVPPVPPAPPAAPIPPAPPVPPMPPAPAPTSKDGTIKRERVTQTYEGLRVEVDRSIETIAAGAIGNSRPIESISERYYSPDLKMNLYTRSSDPRSGESVYRMVDIKRSEPEIGLFRVPAGFTETSGKSK